MLLYLIILIFFIFILTRKSSKFTEIKENKENKDIHTLDTRYNFPTTPPVNPNIYQSVVLNSVPAEAGLYSNQEMIRGYILNENKPVETNQLDYSGGTTQLIKIPLQMNDPYNEQLRSPEILITPYNTVKYKNC